MTWCKGWHDAKVAAASQARQTAGHQPADMAETSLDVGDGGTIDYLDDAFWQDLMAEFSYMPMQLS